jgi:hypothetical protein
VRLSIVDDEEVEVDADAAVGELNEEEVDVDADTAVGELNEEENMAGVAIGLVGVTWLTLSVVVVVVEESWVGAEDEIEVVTTLDEA